MKPDKKLELTPKEFSLLSLLARRVGEVLSRNTIAEQVWDMNFDSDTNVVDVHVRRLRSLYELTGEHPRRLIAAEPADLYEAAVVLADGSEASAMLYPRALIEERGYTDISRYGGWAQYKAALGQ